MSRIVVERSFDSPPSDADIATVADRERPCLQVYGITWRRSLLSEDRRRMVCEYEAADAESVRRAQREAEAQFDHIWSANVIE